MSTASQAISTGPIARPLMSETLAARFAAHPAPTVEARPPHLPRPTNAKLDAGQCRIWLNESRREIDRLRMGLDVRPEIVAKGAKAHGFESVGFAARCGEQRKNLADPPTEPKLYAVDPIGVMPEPRSSTPVEQPPKIRVTNHYHVTNLGTLLDMLA